MKYQFLFTSLTLLAISAFAFTGCSKTENQKGNVSGPLPPMVGEWEVGQERYSAFKPVIDSASHVMEWEGRRFDGLDTGRGKLQIKFKSFPKEARTRENALIYNVSDSIDTDTTVTISFFKFKNGTLQQYGVKQGATKAKVFFTQFSNGNRFALLLEGSFIKLPDSSKKYFGCDMSDGYFE